MRHCMGQSSSPSLESCQVRLLTGRILTGQRPSTVNAMGGINLVQQPQQVNTFTCYVDGSWAQDGTAGIGIGICLMKHDLIVWWVSKKIQAISPTQAEARAILEGFEILVQRANGEGLLFSDSKESVSALDNNQRVISDWRSCEHIWKAWVIQAQAHRKIKAIYCSRDHQNIVIAHNLGV